MRRFRDIIAKEVFLIVLFLGLFVLYGSMETGAIEVPSTKLSTADSMAGDYLSARFSHSLGKMDQAINYYGRALSKDPYNPKLLQTAYRMNIVAGHYDNAVHLAKRHVDIDPLSSLAHLVLAVEDLKHNNFSAVRERLMPMWSEKDQSSNQVNSVIFPLMTAWAASGEEDYIKALSILEELDDKYVQPLLPFQKAVISDLAGQEEQAKQAFDEMSELPQSYRVVMEMARFYERIGQPNKAQEVIEKFTQKNALYEKVLKEYKGPIYERAPDKRSLQAVADVFMEVAGFLYASRQFDNAALYFRMALHLNPQAHDSRLLLAGVMESKQYYEEAVKLYSDIPESSRFFNKAKIGIALAYHHMGNLQEAKTKLLEQAKREPDETEALLNLGDILIGKEHFSEAADIYTQAMERIPSPEKQDWAVYYARGICYERLGEWEKAEKDFFTALELSPEEPDVLNYLGYSWLLVEKNLVEAEEMLEKAVNARPNDAHIIDSYGWALFKLGRFEEALDFLERANLLMPYDPTTNDHLGDIYWRMGRYVEARFQWKRALGFDPEPEEEAKILQKLDQGLSPIAMAVPSFQAAVPVNSEPVTAN